MRKIEAGLKKSCRLNEDKELEAKLIKRWECTYEYREQFGKIR
jgi:hypothetical protein